MRSKRTKRRWISRHVQNAGITIMCLSVVTGCSFLGMLTPAETKSEETAIKSVKVETIMKQRLEEPVEVPGDVMSSIQTEVTAPAEGHVQQLVKHIGDRVQEGEMIARLQSKDVEDARNQAALAVNNANAAIQTAKQDLANGRRELEVQIRKMELELEDFTRQVNKKRNDHDGGSVTRSELTQAEIQLEAFRIELELAKQRLRSMNGTNALSALDTAQKNAQMALHKAEEAVSALEVKSPIGGVITNVGVIEGTAVKKSGIIARIETMDPIQIVVQLSQETAGMVRGRTELTFMLPREGLKEKAKISYIGNIMNPQTKTYEMRLEVPNENLQLKPGMQVLVQLTEESEQIAVSIPQHSLISDGQEKYVFVLQGDVVEKRSVEIGRSNDFYYEVLSGVQEGELLVVTGQSRLEDQEKVFSEHVQR